MSILPGSIIHALSCVSVFSEFLSRDMSKRIGHRIKQASVKT